MLKSNLSRIQYRIIDVLCTFQTIHGAQITNVESTPEIAFSGDTMSDFILDPDNADVLKAKILVVEVCLLVGHHFVIIVVDLLLFSLRKGRLLCRSL